MARGFLKKSGEGPSIRTITSASAREYTREFLSPSEMQPYEVAEILGSDIDSGLTKSGVARARRKYGGNIIREELSLSFGQSLKKQLLGIHGLLVLLCAVILYIFTPDPLYMLLAVCAAAVTLVNAYLVGHGVAAQFPIHPASDLYPQELEQTYTADDCAAAMAELSMADGEWIYSMTLLVNSENSFKVAAAQEIAAALEQYDFDVTVNALPWDEFLAALADGRYDMYYGECKLTADWDASALLGTGGSLNYGGWSDPITDACLADCLKADDSRRAAALESLCRRLQSQTPIIPLCFKRTSLLVPYGAVDHLTPTAADPFSGLEHWEIHWGSTQDK